ncbi:MAG: hypothetical protein Q7S66_02100 [bacterium]|nr:hypothetical protein [bacterium]
MDNNISIELDKKTEFGSTSSWIIYVSDKHDPGVLSFILTKQARMFDARFKGVPEAEREIVFKNEVNKKISDLTKQIPAVFQKDCRIII